MLGGKREYTAKPKRLADSGVVQWKETTPGVYIYFSILVF